MARCFNELKYFWRTFSGEYVYYYGSLIKLTYPNWIPASLAALPVHLFTGCVSNTKGVRWYIRRVRIAAALNNSNNVNNVQAAYEISARFPRKQGFAISVSDNGDWFQRLFLVRHQTEIGCFGWALKNFLFTAFMKFCFSITIYLANFAPNDVKNIQLFTATRPNSAVNRISL